MYNYFSHHLPKPITMGKSQSTPNSHNTKIGNNFTYGKLQLFILFQILVNQIWDDRACIRCRTQHPIQFSNYFNLYEFRFHDQAVRAGIPPTILYLETNQMCYYIHIRVWNFAGWFIQLPIILIERLSHLTWSVDDSETVFTHFFFLKEFWNEIKFWNCIHNKRQSCFNIAQTSSLNNDVLPLPWLFVYLHWFLSLDHKIDEW